MKNEEWKSEKVKEEDIRELDLLGGIVDGSDGVHGHVVSSHGFLNNYYKQKEKEENAKKE